MGRVTRGTETGRMESDIERNYQRKVISLSSVPSKKQLVDGQIARVYSGGNLNLYMRHENKVFKLVSVPESAQSVSGALSDPSAVLASLLPVLANLGLFIDDTTD